MKARVLVAVVGIPALVFVLGFAPEWAAAVLVVAMCAIGAYEFVHAVASKAHGYLVHAAVWAAIIVPASLFSGASTFRVLQSGVDAARLGAFLQRAFAYSGSIVAALVVVLFVYAIWCYEKERAVPFGSITAALFAGLVFPLMLSCLLWLRLMDNGAAWVFAPLCISFGSDTFALFGGMFFGKHKLAPHVSPKKTREGAVGGLVGGVFGMLLFKWIGEAVLGTALLGYGPLVFMGLVGSVIGQIGDLSFSVIKREFGVKDYGKLLPGHGGILDRFDSVSFVAPFVWIALSFVSV